MNRTEKEIIELLASDSFELRKKGFVILYEKYYEAMYDTAYAFFKNDIIAEEVLFHYISKIIKKKYVISNNKIRKNIISFLNFTIKNECINKYKELKTKRVNQNSLQYEELEPEFYDLEKIIHKIYEADLFEDCIDKKNDVEISKFFRLFLEGNKIRDIVKKMNLDYNQTRNVKLKFIRLGKKCAKYFKIKNNPYGTK